MLLVRNAFHVFINPYCLVCQSSIWDSAVDRVGWKCQNERRVMIKQGWNQEPLCRRSCGNWAWSRLHGHKSLSQTSGNLLSVLSLLQSKGKTLCPSKIYSEDRVEGRKQSEGLVGPGQCMYHDWLLQVWGEPLAWECLFSTTAQISTTDAYGSISCSCLTCSAQLLVTQQLFPCVQDRALRSGRACLYSVGSPIGCRAGVGTASHAALLLSAPQAWAAAAPSPNPSPATDRRSRCTAIHTIKPSRYRRRNNSHYQSSCTFLRPQIVLNALDWQLYIEMMKN